MIEENGSSAGREIIKSDTRGRLRVSAKRRDELLDHFENSGLSAAHFAKMHGINYQTFTGWRRRRRQRVESSKVAGSPFSGSGFGFHEVVVERACSAGVGDDALGVELVGGVHLRVANPHQAALAAMLIKQLQDNRPC